jgi:hypothetical protein
MALDIEVNRVEGRKFKVDINSSSRTGSEDMVCYAELGGELTRKIACAKESFKVPAGHGFAIRLPKDKNKSIPEPIPKCQRHLQMSLKDVVERDDSSVHHYIVFESSRKARPPSPQNKKRPGPINKFSARGPGGGKFPTNGEHVDDGKSTLGSNIDLEESDEDFVADYASQLLPLIEACTLQ